jgi:NTP pyrophosphatase (non-canonical NTP hydrolase)
MKKIIDRNYQSIVDRGLISPSTTLKQFNDKLKEEVHEFINYDSEENFREELADIILVCLNISKHYKIDIEKELLKKIKKNEKR